MADEGMFKDFGFKINYIIHFASSFLFFYFMHYRAISQHIFVTYYPLKSSSYS